MLTTKQIITAKCDLCECEYEWEEEIPPMGYALIPVPPNGWWKWGDLILCPRHKSVSMSGEIGGKMTLEDIDLGLKEEL